MKKLLIAILGPTASGKTDFAIELAEKIGGEIICMDSTSIYKGFDIGSAKPSYEQRQKIPHHLVDQLYPDAPFSAHHFLKLATDAISDILSRRKTPILVGGTYFYLRALQHGMYDVEPIAPDTIEALEIEYTEDDNLNTQKMHLALSQKDPESAKAIHPHDRYRLLRALAIIKTTGKNPSALRPTRSPEQEGILWLKYALLISRERLHQNIMQRTEKMIADGIVKETDAIMKQFPNARALGSIGYHEAVQFIQKKITEKQLRSEIIEKTRGLAKKQMTWLRGDPEMRFVDLTDIPRILLEVSNLKFALGETGT